MRDLLKPFVKLLDELSSTSWQKIGLIVFLRCHSSWLHMFIKSNPGAHGEILFVQAATGELEFCRPLPSHTYEWQLCVYLSVLGWCIA